MTYALIQDLSGEHRVKRLCSALCVSTSAFYAYRSGESHRPGEEKLEQAARVAEIFLEHKRRYGSRRIVKELKATGTDIGRKRVRGIMNELGIKAIQPKSFVPKTTVPCDSLLRSPNLLLGKGTFPTGINQVIVGDITYLALADGGWLYLCVWMDLFSRRIVGWSLEDNMGAGMVKAALGMCVRRRKPPRGTIIHSDGGGQMVAIVFRDLIKENGFRQSMTRKDNHYDNAYIESLFSRFKAELMTDYPAFTDLDDARKRVFEYIEGYYNVKRRHSSLGYLSPKQYEENL